MGGLCLFLSVACGFDYWKQRIPNWLVACIAFWGMLFSYHRRGYLGMLHYFGIGIIVLAVGYLVFSFGGMGAGDVKLLAVTVGFLSFHKICSFIFFSMLIATVISIAKMIRRRNTSGKVMVCLSGPILLGVLMYMGGLY